VVVGRGVVRNGLGGLKEEMVGRSGLWEQLGLNRRIERK